MSTKAATHQNIHEKSSREALQLISEQEKLSGGGALGSGLLGVVGKGLGEVAGFIIDSQRKRESVERIGSKLDECVKKLEKVYVGSGNPSIRKAVVDAIDELKGIYSLHTLEIEKMYASNEKVENKLIFYKVVESDAISDMDVVVARLRDAIRGAGSG
ncbi:MAG: hypothetical protein N3G76_00685 [Candidatus Micrarchaeota archaeon]|nr:hypothetical protein [Candidatus Micrarchaeota archaeon]